MNGTLLRKMGRANPGQEPWTGGPWACVYTVTGAKLVSCHTDTGFGFPFHDEFDVLRSEFSYLGMVQLNKSRDNHDWKLSINKELSIGYNWQAINKSHRKRCANP